MAAQGDVNELNDQTILNYLTETIKGAKPPQEFLDINVISVPSKSEIKQRVELNFEKYKGNYLILLCFFIGLFVILNPQTIPLILLWGLYFYSFKKEEQEITVKGMNIKKNWILRGLGVFTLLYVLLIYNVIVIIFAMSSFFALLVFAHMLLFHDKEEDEDV